MLRGFMCVQSFTFPIKWRMYSMIIDIKTSTKQTTATAQVGVCSKDRSFDPLAISFLYGLLPKK